MKEKQLKARLIDRNTNFYHGFDTVGLAYQLVLLISDLYKRIEDIEDDLVIIREDIGDV